MNREREGLKKCIRDFGCRLKEGEGEKKGGPPCVVVDQMLAVCVQQGGR